jgi:peptidoglycan/LPS O-acetylase OafA/YrhL
MRTMPARTEEQASASTAANQRKTESLETVDQGFPYKLTRVKIAPVTKFGNPGMPIIHSAKRIPELDGLRGIAIAMIVYLHYIQDGISPPAHSLWSYLTVPGQLTWTGVDLFFVLSGFLIGGILLDSRESSGYYRTFYIRRFWRIVPIYAVIVLLYYSAFLLRLGGRLAWLGPALNSPLPLGSVPWIYYLTYTQNLWMAAHASFGTYTLGVTWSLAIEEQFYLLLPLVIRTVKKEFLPYVLLGAIGFAPMLRIWILLHRPGETYTLAPYVLMPCRADALMLGVLCAYAVRRPSYWEFLTTHRNFLIGVITVLLAFVVCFGKDRDPGSDFLTISIGYTWMAALYASVLLFSVTQQGSRTCRLLRNRYLMGLGTIAYGTYLIHFSVLWICSGISTGHSPSLRTGRDLVTTLVAVTATVAIAKLSWVLFERPLVNYGRQSA